MIQYVRDDKSQNALWMYLNDGYRDNGNFSIRSCNDGRNIDGSSDLYTKAKKYGSRTNPNITCKLEENIVKISVSGSFSYYNVYINDSLVYEKQTSTNKNIDISNYSGNVKVKVKVYDTKYTVKYRILTSTGGNQKLLVITKKSEGTDLVKEKGDSFEVYRDTNVSLQKYITQVNNSLITTSRANRQATEGTTNAISASIPNSSGKNKKEII